MWTPGYGYLWVSGYPWGYMPFQCGAWNFYDGFRMGLGAGHRRLLAVVGIGFLRRPELSAMCLPAIRPIPRPILPRRPISGRPIPMIAVNQQPGDCRVLRFQRETGTRR